MDCVNLKSYVAYQEESDNLKTAMAWLLGQDLESLENGRHDIEGDDIFALVSEYEAKEPENCRYEYHEKYIDIQFLISGIEMIHNTSLDNMTVTDPYNSTKDIAFGTLIDSKLEDRVIMTPGLAAILYPKDAHQPGMRIVGNNSHIKKIVVKVAN